MKWVFFTITRKRTDPAWQSKQDIPPFRLGHMTLEAAMEQAGVIANLFLAPEGAAGEISVHYQILEAAK